MKQPSWLSTGGGRIVADTITVQSGADLTSSSALIGGAKASNGGVSSLGDVSVTGNRTLFVDSGGAVTATGFLDVLSTGAVNVDGAAISAGVVLNNEGNITLDGAAGIQGNVVNAGGGSIHVASGTATFDGPVEHNGAGFDVSAGSQAVFNGSYTGVGNFTGTGELVFAGDLMPGNSPALVSAMGT